MFRLIFGLCLLLSVYANTEIVNFQVSELYEDEIAVTNSWPVLNHTHAERQLNLIPAPLGSSMEEVCNTGRSNGVDYTCPHELWLLLDLTGNWEKYSRFTLRLSWLASHPVDFSLQILGAQDLLAHLSQHRNHTLNESRPSTHRTRARYARIRAVDIGVLTPYPGSTSSGSTTSQSPSPVPFILIVEPLYFGFLPPTVVPVLWYIVVVVIIACIGLPPLIKYLDGLASQARKELYEDAKPKRE